MGMTRNCSKLVLPVTVVRRAGEVSRAGRMDGRTAFILACRHRILVQPRTGRSAGFGLAAADLLHSAEQQLLLPAGRPVKSSVLSVSSGSGPISSVSSVMSVSGPN